MIAQQTGSHAHALLNVPGYTGSVMLAVSSAVYLLGQDGEVLWLTQSGSPLHQRAVVVHTLPRLEPGIAFTAQAGQVLFDDKNVIDLSRAALWNPCQIGPIRQQALGDCCQPLNRMLDAPGCRGLACTLRDIISQRRGSHTPADHFSAALARQAAAPLQAVMLNCRAGSLNQILQAGLELIGLGPGLTPSGDDFMGALLFTLRYLGAGSRAVQCWEAKAVEQFLAQARPLTGFLSHTILADMAHGNGPAPLHALVGRLAAGDLPEKVMSTARFLTRLGNTSGWDMLAGVIVGIQIHQSSVAA